MGITTCGFQDVNLDSIIQRADQALYQAKDQGRNRSVAIAPLGQFSIPLNGNSRNRTRRDRR